MCEDCGGVLPPPPTAAEKRQAKLTKQRLAKAKKIMQNKKFEDAALDLAVKRMPYPVRVVFNCFGIGV